MISRLSPEQYSTCPVSRHSVTTFGVGVLQELVDEVLGVDVGVYVGMEAELDVELVWTSRPSGSGHRRVAPLRRGQFGGLVECAAMQVGAHLGQRDQVVHVDGCQQLAHRESVAPAVFRRLLPRGVWRCRRWPPVRWQSPLAEFVFELFGVGGQVSERAESMVRKPVSTTSSRNVAQYGCLGSSGNQMPQESGAVPRCSRAYSGFGLACAAISELDIGRFLFPYGAV